MSYESLAASQGKQAVQIVELYMPRCTRTYGSAPCTASIGVTGSDRCYNTRATCQDTANFASATKIYRFASTRVDGLQQLGDSPLFPTLISVQTAPTILTPAQGLGVRSSVTVSINDHPWTDAGIDPYRSQRLFDPDTRGSFWGKFVTRNRFYENRRMDVLTGFLNEDGSFDIANFKRRSYVITTISGPGTGGKVTIHGKDPLTYADGEKAKWPQPSLAKLSAAIHTYETTLYISDPGNNISAWWDLGQRYIRVEQELMLATGISGLWTGSIVLNVVRATMPSWYVQGLNVSADHNVDVTVQPCHLFDQQMVYDIVYFLLNSVAGLPSSYLDYAGWKEYFDSQFQDYRFAGLIAEPVDVKPLLTEISQHNILIFWHDRQQQVVMKALRFIQLLTPTITDDNAIIADTMNVAEDTKNLATQTVLYFDLQWPLALMKELRSYRTVDVRANLNRESVEEYGKPAIREVRSRWLNRTNLALAENIGANYIRQYQDVRKIITFSCDPKDDLHWTGDMVGVSNRYVQDEWGNPTSRNYLITQVQEQFSDNGLTLKYTAVELFSFYSAGVITPDNTTDPTRVITYNAAPIVVGGVERANGGGMIFPDYSAATTDQKNHYAFISPDTPAASPRFADGTKAYQIV